MNDMYYEGRLAEQQRYYDDKLTEQEQYYNDRLRQRTEYYEGTLSSWRSQACLYLGLLTATWTALAIWFFRH